MLLDALRAKTVSGSVPVRAVRAIDDLNTADLQMKIMKSVCPYGDTWSSQQKHSFCYAVIRSTYQQHVDQYSNMPVRNDLPDMKFIPFVCDPFRQLETTKLKHVLGWAVWSVRRRFKPGTATFIILSSFISHEVEVVTLATRKRRRNIVLKDIFFAFGYALEGAARSLLDMANGGDLRTIHRRVNLALHTNTHLAETWTDLLQKSSGYTKLIQAGFADDTIVEHAAAVMASIVSKYMRSRILRTWVWKMKIGHKASATFRSQLRATARESQNGQVIRNDSVSSSPSASSSASRKMSSRGLGQQTTGMTKAKRSKTSLPL